MMKDISELLLAEDPQHHSIPARITRQIACSTCPCTLQHDDAKNAWLEHGGAYQSGYYPRPRTKTSTCAVVCGITSIMQRAEMSQ